MADKSPHPLHDAADDSQGGDRVAKALARSGVASRREVERLIEAGRVALNGKVLTTPAVKVSPGDILTVDGKVVGDREPTRLFRYHKPTGLMTTHNDPKERPTVFQALPAGLPRLISVGRLDLNSEGLLLLTNDGELSRALEMPGNAWVRRYRARAFGEASQEKLDKLKDGITIEGVRYGSIEAKLDKASGRNVWITVTLSEGKNREVRRVLEALGLKVNRLIRLAYGPFALGTLAPGQVEEVGPRVIRELLADIVPAEAMPKGDRPQFAGTADPQHAPGAAGGGDAQRRAPSVGRSGAAAPLPTAKGVRPGGLVMREAEPKLVRKPGWAKPRKKPVIAGRKPGPKTVKDTGAKFIGPKPGALRAAGYKIENLKPSEAKPAGRPGAATSAAKPKSGTPRPAGHWFEAKPASAKPMSPKPTSAKPAGEARGPRPDAAKGAAKGLGGDKRPAPSRAGPGGKPGRPPFKGGGKGPPRPR
jgi:23S rRNA pseudouridine2605 synthase